MEYRLNKQTLTELLGQWNAFLRRKVHLVACGGTARVVGNFEHFLNIVSVRP
jgi:hypothetical protein